MPVNKAYILLGSNEGKRKDYLNKAKKQIANLCGSIEKESSVYETAAWGNTDQQAFLNQIVLIKTNLLPDELMSLLLRIETGLGRVRTVKFGPRTIDLDILFYNDLIHHSKKLILPHPFIRERRFALIPMAELAPRKIHPVFKQTITALLKNCTDTLAVNKLQR